MAGRISEFALLEELPEEAWMEIIVRSGLRWVHRRVSAEQLRSNAAGKSAYELAVEYGFQGTEQQWLDSLKGKSAFEAAQELGYTGTREEWKVAMEALYHLTPEQAGKVLTTDGQILRWLFLTPADIGLGNVNNTADLDKPISTTTQAALDQKLNTAAFSQYFVDKMAEVGIVYESTDETWVHDQGSLP